MPKNVPPEFTGRFSIKRKRSPKRKSEPHAAGPSRKCIQTVPGNASPLRERANSSASSTHHSNAGSETGPTASADSRQQQHPPPDQRYNRSPGSRSERGESSKPRAPSNHKHGEKTAAAAAAQRSPLAVTTNPHDLAESDLIESYNALEASATRTPSSAADSPIGLPAPNPSTSIHEQDIYATFSGAYTRLNSHNRTHRITQVAHALTDGLLRVSTLAQDIYITSILTSLQRFATDNPKSIDFLLQSYHAATALFPDDLVRTEHGAGKHAGMNRFRSWLADESLGFRGEHPPSTTSSGGGIKPTSSPPSCSSTTTTTRSPTAPPRYSSTLTPYPDPHDRSNLKFPRSQISPSHLPSSLSALGSWKRLRRQAITMAALHARAFALGMLKSHEGGGVEELVMRGLGRRGSRWTKVDFVGSCIALRAGGAAMGERWWGGGSGRVGGIGRPDGNGGAGGANSSSSSNSSSSNGMPIGSVFREGVEKRAQLRSMLEGFLLQDGETWDDEFGIKVHAMMALKHLLTDSLDETSEQVFRTSDWVF